MAKRLQKEINFRCKKRTDYNLQTITIKVTTISAATHNKKAFSHAIWQIRFSWETSIWEMSSLWGDAYEHVKG